MRGLVAYGRKVYGLPALLEATRDGRDARVAPAPLVAASALFAGLLRVRSFNALEPRLREKSFLHLVGAPPNVAHLGSADTLRRSLVRMELEPVRQVAVSIVTQAERNKVFREGWHGAKRYVAFDGWEPVCSFRRHCPGCLVRRVKVKQADGTLGEVEQYFHRYVVALLIDERFDMALDIEPLLPQDLRPGPITDRHEGELTAAMRLLPRVHRTYGWLDVVVADALYANGPFLTLVQQLRMGAVIIARKDSDDPLRSALEIWGDSPSEKVVFDHEAQEQVELWDCPGLETLSTYEGPIRVVRAKVTKASLSEPKVGRANAGHRSARRLREVPQRPAKPRTWCMLVTGKATTLPAQKVLAVARSRWHIENTAFHQWTVRWRFGHVFVHDDRGILVLFWLFFAAFNLLTLYLYRQVRCYGRDRGRDVTRTISRLVDEMLDDLARLDTAISDFG